MERIDLADLLKENDIKVCKWCGIIFDYKLVVKTQDMCMEGGQTVVCPCCKGGVGEIGG